MLKTDKIKFVYINVRHEIREFIMNGILAKSTETRASKGLLSPAESVETAGSLAMNQFHSLFEANVYDMFTTDNPFAVDYSLYSDCGESVAYSGFLSSFSNAVSTLTSAGDCSFSGDCGFSGSCGGGFTSVC